jgi:FkbM family methyltransferase
VTTSPPAVDSPLDRLFADIDLCLVDIGARGQPLKFMRRLMPFTHYVACEPDRVEAERLKDTMTEAGEWRAFTVFSEAIGAGEGDRRLLLTNGPGMSSLLEPDASLVERYCKGEAFRVVDSISVPTISLDAAARAYGFEDAAFIKVDTQGTELEILASGERLVSQSLVGVYVETLFHPFYRDQSLFADVDAFLRQHDFTLFDLARTHLRRTPAVKPFFSRRPIVWAHCLYLKNPDALERWSEESARRAVLRLAAMATVFQHYDFALEVLTRPLAERLVVDHDLEALRQDVRDRALRDTRRMLRLAISDEECAALVACSDRDTR